MGVDTKLSTGSALVEELKGPYLVARFQRWCGVRRVTKKKSDDNNDGDDTGGYEVQRKWLHYLFLFGTSLGDELFYSIFFTFWFWSVDGAVGRRVVLVWAICMYVGQSLKDIIRWPRPSSPPAVKMESRWNLEYGMPSTHAIVGAEVPLSIIYFTSSRYQYSVWMGITVAVSICTLVCLSRLYLGMHSVLDILAGLTLVGLLLPVVIPLVDTLDSFFFTHEMGGFSLIALGLLLCLCYPTGDRWTPARGDTFVIVGSAIGLNLGSWLNYQLGIIRGPPPSSPPYAVMWPTGHMIGLLVLRQILGLILVVLSKTIGRKLMTSLQTRLQLPDERLKSTTEKNPGIVTELFTKFFTYILVGFTVTHIATNLFRSLGIERPSFHTEI